MVEILSFEQLLQAPDPLTGLSRVLAHVSAHVGCDRAMVRADGPDGPAITHVPDGADLPEGAFATVLAVPVALYGVRVGEVTLYWRRADAGSTAPQQLAVVLPLLGLALSLCVGVGVATAAADVAEASLLATEALSAGAAHEWNNLLTAMGFQCELLRDSAGEQSEQIAALERLVTRGGDLAAALLTLSKRPDPGGWCPVRDVVEYGQLYLRMIWYGKHLRLTVAGPPPPMLVPASTAHAAFRWALRYLAINGPRGWQAALHSASDGSERLLLAVVSQEEDLSGLVPGSGLPDDAPLQALRALLRCVGGEAGMAVGTRGPKLALWLHVRKGE